VMRESERPWVKPTIDRLTVDPVEINRQPPEKFLGGIYDALKIPQEERTELTRLFKTAYEKTERLFDERKGLYYCPALPESAEFANRLLPFAIDLEKSTFSYPADFTKLPSILGEGQNVILSANHQSGSDPMVVNLLLDRIQPGLQSKSVVIADIPTLSLGDATLFNCFNKLQVNSLATVRIAPPDEARLMRSQNINAMRAFRDMVKEGSRLIVVFPEAILDRGKLRNPNIGSSQIFDMAMAYSPKGGVVYPVHIDGTREILPEGTAFYNAGGRIKKGPVDAKVGEGMPLEELSDGLPKGPGRKRQMLDRVMVRMAQLAPPEKRGRYASRV
jgi:1-acyl-sn-glycerol-3-phosphate acyltransferase